MAERKEHARKMKEFEEITSRQSDVLRIAVCGKFKTGKTSLLNLLLGLDLPVMAVTATGVVTKIICHASMSAEFEDGSRKEITKNELDRYITIAGKDLDGIRYSEAVSVDVPCENPLMMDGKVEFWDTPGLEDDEHLTEITMNAIKKCDLAVLVMNAAQILSQKEKMFLYQMQEMLGGNVLVVINRWDMLRDDEKPGVRKTAETFLKKFGNDLCGYGRCLMTSANPDTPDIVSLRNRLYDICGEEKVRKGYRDFARSAKINYFAAEWEVLLEQDIARLRFYLIIRQIVGVREQNKRVEELEKECKEKKDQVKSALSELMCKVDQRSYWTAALNEVKSTIGWETNYVKLSTDIMKKSLRQIYQRAREVTGEHFPAREFPECYPLPEMSEEKVWENMAWGTSFAETDERYGGMLAGIAAGAVAGSVIPGLGTVIGAGLGVLAGVFAQSKMDERSEQNERQKFKSSCMNKTVTAFCQGPAANAKREMQNYMTGLFQRLDAGLTRKREEIGSTLNDNAYCASKQLLDELQRYRKKVTEERQRRV